MAEQRLPHISYAGWSLATPLDLSQTIDGYTFDLKRAYADAGGILLTVSFSGHQDGTELFCETHLTTREGVQFESGGVQGMGNEEASLSFELPSDFTPSERLDLHLEVRVHIQDWQREVGEPMVKPGPFNFDFSMPLQPTRTIEINQTLTDEGNTLSLVRLELVPSGALVYLTLPPAADTPYSLINGRLTLQTPKAQAPSGYHGSVFKLNRDSATMPIQPSDRGNRLSDPYFDEAPLYKQDGEWVLKVEGLQYRDLRQRLAVPPEARTEPRNGMVGAGAYWVSHDQPMPLIPDHTAIPGTWVFKFTVPPYGG